MISDRSTRRLVTKNLDRVCESIIRERYLSFPLTASVYLTPRRSPRKRRSRRTHKSTHSFYLRLLNLPSSS